MKKRNGSGSGIYIILITAFFLGCFLLLVIFGTNIYRKVADRQAANNNERAVLGYLLTVTKMGESDIHVEEDETAGSVLIVEDSGTGYGNRIYLNDGYIVEDYGKVSGNLMPDYATRIGQSSVFEIEDAGDELLKVITDQGSVFIHVRQGDR